MLMVDTNVLVDVLQDDPQWADWSITKLRAQAKLHALVINPVIYAEMSLSFSTLEALDDVVLTLALELREIPRPALFLAARAYAQYRRRGGSKRQCCPTSSSEPMLPSRVGPCSLGTPTVSKPTSRRLMSLPREAACEAARRWWRECLLQGRLPSDKHQVS
jgi:predicted nucleic acid-binding protein